MPIVVRSPTDEPFGCLHPEHVHGFTDDGHYWRTVADHAHAHGTTDDEGARAVALRTAMLRSFESNLEPRAVLLSTGSEDIECDGAPRVGPALMEVRAVIRRRADDPEAVQCEHRDEEAFRCVCEHRLDSPKIPFHRHFTGNGSEHHILCERCVAALPKRPPLRKVCVDCFSDLLSGARRADVGTVGIKERTSDGFHFVHRDVSVGIDPSTIVAFAPVLRQPGVWLTLDRSGVVYRTDFSEGLCEPVCAIDAGAVDLNGKLDLAVSPDGRIAAVAETVGRRAVVFDAKTGVELRRLMRDDYHFAHCRYPLAFFELDGRACLMHATSWNRLDVQDAATGECLTARVANGQEHHLDYFHAGLEMSPDGARVIDNGWVWHPVGIVRVFDVRRWLEENPWESEHGPSVHSLCSRTYYWDGPVAWLDDRTVAVWGEGDDDERLIPAALIFDAETGEELHRFAGPAARFACASGHLIAWDAQGAAAWDWRTGERLVFEPSLVPIAVHPTSNELLSLSSAGGYRVSRLVATRSA